MGQQVGRVCTGELTSWEGCREEAVGYVELIINTLNPLLEADTCSLAFKQLSKAHTLLEMVVSQVGERPFVSACIH